MGRAPDDDLVERIYVGCAGWSIPAAHGDRFPREGAHLQRYAARFDCVEINSSFYRSHRPSTYARWAATTPERFRFAVKMSREISHVRRLVGTEELVRQFAGEVAALGPKRGPLLVQLPPRLGFDAEQAGAFFRMLRERAGGSIVCEPRHPSWFEPEAEDLLRNFEIGRVAADPAVVSAAAQPGGWSGLVYYRLHGSPRMYYSAYAPDYLQALGRKLRTRADAGAEVWCIFDNTAEGAATVDALSLRDLLVQDWRAPG